MSRPEIELRPATSADAPAIAEIWHAGWMDGHLASASPELLAARTEESFRTRAPRRVGDTTVAVSDGQVVGFVMVVGDEVEQVYVAADHRGSGAADMLLAEAEGRIKDAGHPSAWLAVVADNARARRFYERRGWSDRGRFDYVTPGGGEDAAPVSVPCLRYVKDLEPGEPYPGTAPGP